jgi:hypothetical protein
MAGMCRVTAGGMGMVGRFFVVSGLVMPCCFAMVARRMGMVFGGLFVMLGCFLGHLLSSSGRVEIKTGRAGARFDLRDRPGGPLLCFSLLLAVIRIWTGRPRHNAFRTERLLVALDEVLSPARKGSAWRIY